MSLKSNIHPNFQSSSLVLACFPSLLIQFTLSTPGIATGFDASPKDLPLVPNPPIAELFRSSFYSCLFLPFVPSLRWVACASLARRCSGRYSMVQIASRTCIPPSCLVQPYCCRATLQRSRCSSLSELLGLCSTFSPPAVLHYRSF